jgi:hypothetical protein
MAYIIKDYNIRYGGGSANGTDSWYHVADEEDYENITEVEEDFPNAKVRKTNEDFWDLCNYEQDELEEVFNEASGGYTP